MFRQSCFFTANSMKEQQGVANWEENGCPDCIVKQGETSNLQDDTKIVWMAQVTVKTAAKDFFPWNQDNLGVPVGPQSEDGMIAKALPDDDKNQCW